eukprot:GILK01011992.1.p1 GENE.GILK01011992.1~~GILK01011992.1.p1  ORF type:complete len:490 (-),score=125.18 GILK01011992.1:80-1525(-)
MKKEKSSRGGWLRKKKDVKKDTETTNAIDNDPNDENESENIQGRVSRSTSQATNDCLDNSLDKSSTSVDINIDKEDVDVTTERNRRQQQDEDRLKYNPILVYYRYIPRHVRPPVFAAHRAILLAERWSVDPSLLGLLSRVLDNLGLVTNARIRAGLLLRVWRDHVIQLLNLLLNMVESYGKISQEAVDFWNRCPIQESDLPLFMSDAARLLKGLQKCFGVLADTETESTPDDSTYWPPLNDSIVESACELADALSPDASKLVEAHLLMLKILHCVSAYGLVHVKPSQLIPQFTTMNPLTSSDENQSVDILSQPSETVMEKRLKFLYQLIQHDPTTAYTFAADLNVQIDPLRREHARVLYEAGKDSLAEELLLKVEDLTEMAKAMVDVGHRRLAATLHSLQSSSRYAVLLSTISADVVREIAAAPSSKPFRSKQKLDQPQPSLHATRALLARAVSLLPPEGDVYQRGKKLCDAASAILRQSS